MSKNFLNRIITSFFLSIILLFFLFTHKILWTYLVITISIISFFEFNNLIKKSFKKDKKKIYFFDILSIIYLSFLVLISHDLYSQPPVVLLFLLLICIFSDTGGYLTGKLIGGKKLTSISPNKTISGSFGSFFFSIIPAFIYITISNQIEITGVSSIFNTEDIMLLIVICLFLSLTCQLGDLSISYFKRLAKVKDTGSLLPGHGGLLDRIDGAIFVLPIAFILDKLLF